jgi:hypothetical protein
MESLANSDLNNYNCTKNAKKEQHGSQKQNNALLHLPATAPEPSRPAAHLQLLSRLIAER